MKRSVKEIEQKDREACFPVFLFLCTWGLLSLNVLVEKFHRTLHGYTKVFGDIVIVPFVGIQLNRLVGLLHFLVKHFRKLDWDLFVGGAVLDLNRALQVA